MTEQQIIEAMAKNVYTAILFGRTDPPQWVDGGNSIAQDYARKNGRAAYAVARAAVLDEVIERLRGNWAWNDEDFIQDVCNDLRAMKGNTHATDPRIAKLEAAIKKDSQLLTKVLFENAELITEVTALRAAISDGETLKCVRYNHANPATKGG